MRGIPQRNAAAHRGEWLKTATGSHEVRGKTLGIVGYGHIGTQVGVLAESLGMQVVFHDIETQLALGNARQAQSLEALLEVADVVTLHVPETASTFQMIGGAQLARMKPGAALINASRGTVVEIEALAEALRAKHLAGAAIDVFPAEPKSTTQEFLSPLRGMDNVLLTPHIGGSTVEAQENIGVEVASKLIKYSNNGSTLGAVNFPEVSLPEYPGKHRVLHIHRNQPGVLSAINAVFSQEEINIAAEYLQTDAKVGYVVIDIETGEREETQEIRRKLEMVPGRFVRGYCIRPPCASPARSPHAASFARWSRVAQVKKAGHEHRRGTKRPHADQLRPRVAGDSRRLDRARQQQRRDRRHKRAQINSLHVICERLLKRPAHQPRHIQVLDSPPPASPPPTPRPARHNAAAPARSQAARARPPPAGLSPCGRAGPSRRAWTWSCTAPPPRTSW